MCSIAFYISPVYYGNNSPHVLSLLIAGELSIRVSLHPLKETTCLHLRRGGRWIGLRWIPIAQLSGTTDTTNATDTPNPSRCGRCGCRRCSVIRIRRRRYCLKKN